MKGPILHLEVNINMGTVSTASMTVIILLADRLQVRSRVAELGSDEEVYSASSLKRRKKGITGASKRARSSSGGYIHFGGALQCV